MSGVYVVLAVNDKAEIEACETYAGVQTALGRAWHLAVAKSGSNPIWANPSPNEEKLEDGSVRWVLLETSKHFVAVFYKTIEVALNSKKDAKDVVRTMSWQTKDGYNIMKPPPISFTDFYQLFTDGYQSSFMTKQPPAPLPPDLPEDKSLPAGWNFDNKPITMAELIDDPFNVKPHSELSEAQKWALVIARVNKRPNFRLGGFIGDLKFQKEALEDLKARNADGLTIRNHELGFIEKALNEQDI